MRHALLVGSALAVLIASQAGAAERAVRAPVYKAPPATAMATYDWSGFYVGVYGATGHGSSGFYAASSGFDEGEFDVTGWLAGGQIGFNWQVGAVVLGVEADGGFADVHGDRVSGAFPTDRIGTSIDRIGTVAARLGYADGNALFYAKAGAAWAHNEQAFSNIAARVTYTTVDDTRWGWMVGAGVEYGIAPNWSLKLEYNYMDFGTAHYRDLACPLDFCTDGLFDEDIAQRIHVVKIGVNYRFGGATPVVARY
jgi:outer membrane immunogenic protein